MITEKDNELMLKANDVAKECPIDDNRYNVGAIITDKDGNIITTGYSREVVTEKDGAAHAEETAINKAKEKGIDLSETTLYTTIEPCGLRLTGFECCSHRIINSRIRRVVFGINEPSHLVANCTGAKQIQDSGIEIEQIKNPKIIKSIINTQLEHMRPAL